MNNGHTTTIERPRVRPTCCNVCGRPGDPFQDGRLCMAPIRHPDGTKTLCNGTIVVRPEEGYGR